MRNFLPASLAGAGRVRRRWVQGALALSLYAVVALARPAYQGATGAALFQKAQQLEAAGNRAAAATAYQQAYAAYMSVDDSEGMTKALAARKAVEGGRAAPPLAPAAAAAPRPAAAQPARPAAAAAKPLAAAPTPLAGSMAGGRPVGLFFMTRYLMALHSLEKATYYFTPGGQVYQNPTDFSAAALAALPANLRGTYSLAGNKLTMRWANGQADASDIEPQAITFAWDMGLFMAVRPFANARQLVGTFEGGNSVSLGGGSTAVVSGLTLRPDGTYSRGSTSSLSSSSAASTAHAGASGSTTGRWSLSGWLLTLTDAQGQATRGVAYPIETDEKTGQLTRFYFGNIAYKRL